MSQADLDKMLKEVDTDNSGSIEFNEFCVYMVNRLKPQDIKKKAFDVRQLFLLSPFSLSHYSLSFSHISSLIYPLSIYFLSLSPLSLKACDRDGNGLIGPEEFVEIMKHLGDDTVTVEHARDMIKRIDKDGNEKISYDGK